ncbi:DoxX family protein [Pseudonocardia bannensis]|uniref:Uncharacterized protein n=1 Tax=Pseudonocardia bannensis TaxID=630973 RepID=A0A848DBK8_9PSEU|nr:DoxX family protein [Pseudonocardia bannensis]NMH90210.1 hypothetical protein [Pseudonocardia bannensis]
MPDPTFDGAIKAIGALEILAAIGLVLPWATGIAPVLTRWRRWARCC